MFWLYDEKYIAKTGNPWQSKYQIEREDLVPHAGAFLEFDALRHVLKEEVIVKLASEVAFSLLRAKDVVAMYLASSATVDTSLTECTLTVAMGAGESSQISCSRPMLDAARLELEQAALQDDAKTLSLLQPCPMRITVTSCMANPVGTSHMTADALTSLIEQHEFTIGKGKCEVAFQDFDVVPMYSTDLVERLEV
jgi:hypothetical protein